MFCMVVPIVLYGKYRKLPHSNIFRAACTILILLDVAKLIINKQQYNFIGLKL